MISRELKAYEVKVYGLVQGVGFRPFVYRQAKYFNIVGWVENRTDCVKIKAVGNVENLKRFIFAIKANAPKLARVESLVYDNAKSENIQGFSVRLSKETNNKSTLIMPDVSVCDECLNDIKAQSNRLNYPFVNCTNCGPRFTLIKNIPYERHHTTMNEFAMCSECREEYNNPENRRFHAQPIACSNCGPKFSLVYKNKRIQDQKEIVDSICELIKAGKIVAIKGVGGFHLVCDAKNDSVVKRLRTKKNRERKPFAVLIQDTETVKKYAYVNIDEETLLQSYQRPIVLLRKRLNLAPNVTVGLDWIGAMLPYVPLHYLIFENYKFEALVFTSGNVIGNPIIINNSEAEKELCKISDAIVTYNREIYNHCDDSVTMVINAKNRVIRRSRGYVPESINLNINVDGILGTGAELKNCFCIGKENMAIFSQHIGDLKNFETFVVYKKCIERFNELFRFKPIIIAHDLHPDYLSTRYAENMHIETICVQHHHAHVVSCMAENGYFSNSIGIGFDGTGLGDDGNLWGGEVFIIKDISEYKRYLHLEYIPMPGGETVIKEPWRMAISYLYKIFGRDFFMLELPFLKEISFDKANLLISIIDNNVNTPLTSSMGRLFDAVSSILNICLCSAYEAEAPMRLESIIDDTVNEKYEYIITNTIDVKNIIKGIVNDIIKGEQASTISAKFHNSIVSIILDAASKIRQETGINSVVLSGGLFQNSYILRKSENLLQNKQFDLYTHSRVPSNDGGIALGQLVVAAKMRGFL